MERDAISAGVSKIGGLFSTTEIRTLICYILANIETPLSGHMLCEVLHSEGIVNIFEVSDSLAFLEKSGHIKEIDNSGDYAITDTGRNVSELLNTHLSSVVKERACRAILKALLILRNSKETSYRVFTENDRRYIECSALDRDIPFMRITLQLPNEDQAQYIKQKFLEHADEIYSKVFNIILS